MNDQKDADRINASGVDLLLRPMMGDVDSSGAVNIFDITAIIGLLYNMGPELNCP